MPRRSAVVCSLVLLLLGCGDEPIDLGTADLVGTWDASWGPLSGTAVGNEWTCTQTGGTTLTVTATPGGGLGGTASSLIMHCIGTFTTPAHYVDGVLTTQAIVSGTWDCHQGTRTLRSARRAA
jgi:hypothetical protein